jgi:hypothetical protein
MRTTSILAIVAIVAVLGAVTSLISMQQVSAASVGHTTTPVLTTPNPRADFRLPPLTQDRCLTCHEEVHEGRP